MPVVSHLDTCKQIGQNLPMICIGSSLVNQQKTISDTISFFFAKTRSAWCHKVPVLLVWNFRIIMIALLFLLCCVVGFHESRWCGRTICRRFWTKLLSLREQLLELWEILIADVPIRDVLLARLSTVVSMLNTHWSQLSHLLSRCSTNIKDGWGDARAPRTMISWHGIRNTRGSIMHDADPRGNTILSETLARWQMQPNQLTQRREHFRCVSYFIQNGSPQKPVTKTFRRRPLHQQDKI